MCNANTFGMAGAARQVVHRRDDGTPCFFNDDDYLVYLDCLQDAAARHHCAIHCYVLLPDRAQLLVSPEAENRLPVMMRCVGGRYAEYMHYIYQHHGAFWEHGTKFSMVGGERDLLACHRTIESAPVQARLAAGAAEYRWSSYRHHAHGSEDAVVRDHPCYLNLGTTRSGRQSAYRELFRQLSPGRQADENPLKAHLSRLAGRDGATPGAAVLAPAA
jgi:REP-associated tyrosine transposase